MTHRQHVSYDAAVQLDDVPFVHAVVSHVCAVDEPQLHDGSNEKLIDVSRHDFCFVLLPQHLVNLQRRTGFFGFGMKTLLVYASLKHLWTQ